MLLKISIMVSTTANKTYSLTHKIMAFVLIVFLISMPLPKIDSTYTDSGVYFCKPVMCDPTPTHLSHFCDEYHL